MNNLKNNKKNNFDKQKWIENLKETNRIFNEAKEKIEINIREEKKNDNK